MKHLVYIIVIGFIIGQSYPGHAQTINWKSLEKSQRHLINGTIGFDRGTNIGVGYAYHFNTKLPLILNIEYSQPTGDRLFDDFKTKIGGQASPLHWGDWYLTAKAHGVVRRFQNEMATLFNFGSEFSGTVGYYRKHWFAAGEFGFDKAIVTHIKHSDLMKENNPDLESGWYIPTGGNYFYGVMGGYSFGRNDLTVKMGRTIAEDFKTKHNIPYYVQVGWNVRW